MPRPKSDTPTPAELEVLKILWEQGPSTVREVMDALPKQRRSRAYTSVMSLLNVMAEKKLVHRQPRGRAFVYSAAARRDRTLNEMVSDLCRRAFEGSASTMVTHLLAQANPNDEELDAIREAIEAYQNQSDAEDD